jgi:uncharacterized protein with PQ loop repeat
VSPLVVLGTLGTLVSTITIVPHVVHAMRTRQPGGSPLAWVMGVTGSTIWSFYGIASGDLLVGAPGLVTIPCGLLLAIWSLRGRDAEPAARARPAAAEDVYVPEEWLAADHTAGDTRELPAVA